MQLGLVHGSGLNLNNVEFLISLKFIWKFPVLIGRIHFIFCIFLCSRVDRSGIYSFFPVWLIFCLSVSLSTKTVLTLSQTTNFRLFQTEKVCRRQ